MTSQFFLIQLGSETFGKGDTIEAAREDSREWLDAPEEADNVPFYNNAPSVNANCMVGDLIIVPISVAIELGDYEQDKA